MSEVKQHLTYQEKIEKLRSRGCIINNDTFEKYKDDIELYHLAFPADWADKLVKV